MRCSVAQAAGAAWSRSLSITFCLILIAEPIVATVNRRQQINVEHGPLPAMAYRVAD